MKSLFDQAYTAEFISRINQLTPQSKALWGKMDVAQMLAHCQTAFCTAFGSFELKFNPLLRFLFGKFLKKKVVNDTPFKQNLPAFSEAKISDTRLFEWEKKKLIELITRFQLEGRSGVIENHAIFGKMTPADWDTLMIKHLDHHLRQFGV
jgi:hypothetical protein